jgi:hypothetical protein
MIRLSVRTMAQYLISDEPARLQLLRERKFHAPESIGRARFYAEARNAIASYHRGAIGREMVEARIIAMRRDARYAGPFLRAELLNNADVLERYLYYQGHRDLAVAPPLAATVVRGDVEIAVRPTLFAIENGEDRRLIFLELREKSSRAMMRITAELAFEAFRSVLRDLPARAIQVIDVRQGIITELQHAGTGTAVDVAAACRSISEAWPRLTPPKGARQVSPPAERQLAIAWDVEP